MYHLTYQQLLVDLHRAYQDAKRNKGNKPYVRSFEQSMEVNLQTLARELWSRTYKPRPSVCFIITDPKKREVFAADFRDRIVHHLYYNYTHELFERTFIRDSYSCIPERGTLYGVERLEKHIRQESLNYQQPCYVLKMDIRGYFMHINRQKLLELCLNSLHSMAKHRILKRKPHRWEDEIDIDFVSYLTREIALLNPIENSRITGSSEEWRDLPNDKSLFHSPKGCGLPIGNLTSQLFSNVYLNALDQYCKRVLKCRHYGRYVDDFYVVSCDKAWLRSLIAPIRCFLEDELSLELHEGKISIESIRQGVSFLGFFVKPWRRRVNRRTLRRMCSKFDHLRQHRKSGEIGWLRLASAVASFQGILSHGKGQDGLYFKI